MLLSSAGHLAMVGGGFRLMPIASREERRETGRPHLTATDKVRASRQRILPALLLPPLLQLMLMPGIHSGKLAASAQKVLFFYLCLESFEVCLHAADTSERGLSLMTTTCCLTIYESIS